MDVSHRVDAELREQRRRFLGRVCTVATVIAAASLVFEATEGATPVSELLARSINVVGLGSVAVLLHRRRLEQPRAELGALLVVAVTACIDLVGRTAEVAAGHQPFATWINAWLAYVVLLQIGSHLVWSTRVQPWRRNAIGLVVAYALLAVTASVAPATSADLGAALAVPPIATAMLHAMHRMTAHVAQYEEVARAEAQAGRTDHLTGVLNRRGVLPHLETLAPGDGVLLLDVDHFKLVNDEHGHAVGDEVLRQIADLLAGTVRADDVVARWGGEEFLVVTAGTDDPADRRGRPRAASAEAALAERVRRAVAGGRTMVPTTVSVGVALMEEDDGDWQDVLRRADVRLYLAKERGRDQVVDAA